MDAGQEGRWPTGFPARMPVRRELSLGPRRRKDRGARRRPWARAHPYSRVRLATWAQTPSCKRATAPIALREKSRAPIAACLSGYKTRSLLETAPGSARDVRRRRRFRQSLPRQHLRTVGGVVDHRRYHRRNLHEVRRLDVIHGIYIGVMRDSFIVELVLNKLEAGQADSVE